MATERDLAIRLSLKDSETVRRALTALGDDGQKALARIEQASAPASKALLAFNDVAGNVRGSMEGLTGRLGMAGTALSALGPAGLMAGVSLAALSVGLTKGVHDAELADASMRRLEAVLTATGHASGLTGAQIAEMADKIEKSTMRTAEEVVDATAILATFRSVSGDTFRRATGLVVDLSEVMQSDLKSASLQLGKALQDPIQGVSALGRAGVTFSAAQKDMIAAMVEAGNTAGAQKLVLDELERQVGGASSGADGGLTGATKHLSESWGDLLEEFARTTGIGDAVAGALNKMTEALKGMTASEDVSAELAERSAALVDYQAKLAELEGSGRGWSIAANFYRARIKEIGNEVAALKKLDDARQASEQAAREGAANAARDANAERMAERLKALEAERVKAAADAASKVRGIEEQLAKDVAAAQAKSSLAGVTQADVDKEVALLRDVARQKIDAVQKPLLEAQQRAAEQTAKVLGDLQREVGGVADPRGAFVDQKVSTLPKAASDDERQQAAALAGELYDLTEARKADAKAEDQRARAIERSKQFLLQHADAETVYKMQLEEIAELKRTGSVDEQTYTLMVEDAERRKLRASKSAADGMTRAIQDYADKASDFASGMESAWTMGMQGAEDATVKFVRTGKLQISSLADSFLDAGARMMAQQIWSPIWSGIGGMLSGISLFHAGGEVGAGAPMTRMVDPRVFVGAPKLHSGGLLPGERAIVAKDGERVLTEAQQDNTAATISGLAKMAASGSGEMKVVSTVYNNAAGTEARTQVSRGADGAVQIDTIVETIEGRMATNIAKGRGIAPTLEGRYGLSSAAGAARG